MIGFWYCGGWWVAVGRIARLRKRETERERETVRQREREDENKI